MVVQIFNTALKMNRITKFQITAAACLLAILCYGLPFHDNALGGFVKPTFIIMAKSQKNGDDPKKKAEQLMKSSEAKKKAAAQQETLGKAQIKNKVKEGSMGSIAPYTKKMGDIGKPIPVGQQRLDIAKKLRQEASKDSLKAVKMYPPITPKKKK